MVLNGIPISENECIGDSLDTINNAFQTLSTTVDSFNVVDSSTIDLDWNASTRTLSSSINNGFIFVPVNDPTNPSNNNSNVGGVNVITWGANGSTSATPYTGATQTANLASIVPDNAYMVLVKLFTSSNLFSNTGTVIYVRKSSTASWVEALTSEGLGTLYETSVTIVIPIIFNRASKSFQAYLYDPKSGGAPTSTPNYNMGFNVLGYYIK